MRVKRSDAGRGEGHAALTSSSCNDAQLLQENEAEEDGY